MKRQQRSAAATAAPESPSPRLPVTSESAVRRDPGQLGRKGSDTRRRLMDAANELLASHSPVDITVTAVARVAGTSLATFYVYFGDITDVIYELAKEGNDDLDEVLDVLAVWRQTGDAVSGAARFVDTFHAHWNRYRTILSIRNMEADRGNDRFRRMRREAGTRIIEALADIMQAAHGGADALHREAALARVMVIFAAIERLAAAVSLYPEDQRRLPVPDELRAAQIAILRELMQPLPVCGPST